MEDWLSRIDAGDTEAAWTLFLDRYRGTILAVIRRLITERDDVMDVFATVCAALAANGGARLRQYSQRAPQASVAAWLVVVVRNLTIDWIRGERGRRRVVIPDGLTPLQRAIFTSRCLDGSSTAEAYELLRARLGIACSYPEFLREARATHLAAPCPDRRVETVPWEDGSAAIDLPAPSEGAVDEFGPHLAALLGDLAPDLRVAIELFVLDGVAAADVARLVRWPNAKTVYNRVYRALEAMRSSLGQRGIRPENL